MLDCTDLKLDFASNLDCPADVSLPDGLTCQTLTVDNLNAIFAYMLSNLGDENPDWTISDADCAAGTITITDGTGTCTIGGGGAPPTITALSGCIVGSDGGGSCQTPDSSKLYAKCHIECPAQGGDPAWSGASTSYARIL